MSTQTPPAAPHLILAGPSQVPGVLGPAAAPPPDPDGAIREAALARRWSISRRTLQRWRKKGTGPPWFRVKGVVLYRIADIRALEGAGLGDP